MQNAYLESARKQFEYYKLLGDKTLVLLNDEQLFRQYHADSNSIAMIVKHLWGNMKSRWTNFLESDGEKPWRERDAEFENDISSRQELMEKWEEGWACLFTALNSLSDQDLDRIVYIRNQGHTVMEAINRQLAHYPYHIGQMIFWAKMMCPDKWISLSIPKGKSEDYNAVKFASEKKRQHFTDEFRDKP